MSEAKPMASLSSTLLARKGQAKPAMRPQGFASFNYGSGHGHDDLGWNDMGTEPGPVSAEIVPIVAPAIDVAPLVMPTAEVVVTPPEPPAVVRQQEELARELATPAVVTAPPYVPTFAPTPRAAPGSKAKAAFTLRLDPDRHLRLRLACAVAHRSAQSVVIEALDAFLNNQPAVNEMARTAATTNDR